MMKKSRYRMMAEEAIADPVLQKALSLLLERFGRGTERGYRKTGAGDLRAVAKRIRAETIEDLPRILSRLVEKLVSNNARVFFAETGDQAAAHCVEIARRHGVKRVVKGKSMVTEEIHLNHALEAEGIRVTETDLGEYIVQLAGQRPSHIIAPAIHKTREQIGRLFQEKLGIEYTDDPTALTLAARAALRKAFLKADMGITGCNLACAETGHITTVSNEGNIRMSSTLPAVQVVCMGMERVTPLLEDFGVFFSLLPLAAAAQQMATYVTFMGGPRHPDQLDGPDHLYVIIIDNGRSRILADKRFREILRCIRCAACLNVCPVYRKIGGFTYQHTYCGPVGAVLAPLLGGIEEYRDLCHGESLCGACRDACPVDIDIPGLILKMRSVLAYGDAYWSVKGTSFQERAVFSAWSHLVSRPAAYDIFFKGMSAIQKILPEKRGMITRLPPPFSGWTSSRSIPPLSARGAAARIAARRRR